MTEWLWWWIRNPLGSARRGSNPLAVAPLSLGRPTVSKALTPVGFEPLRAEPNGFLVHHLNHSVTLSLASKVGVWLAEKRFSSVMVRMVRRAQPTLHPYSCPIDYNKKRITQEGDTHATRQLRICCLLCILLTLSPFLPMPEGLILYELVATKCFLQNSPPAGLEPAIFGLEVRRLVH